MLLYPRAGHGNSQGPLTDRIDFSYPNEVQTISPALLRHFDILDPVFFGHGEGVVIGILYSASHCDAESLILESPFLVATASVRKAVRRRTAEYPASQTARTSRKLSSGPEADFYSWALWAGAHPDGELAFVKALSSVTCPVLFLQGSNDPFGISEHAEALFAALPSAERKEMVGAAYTLHREREAETLMYSTEFLSNKHDKAVHGYGAEWSKTRTGYSQKELP